MNSKTNVNWLLEVNRQTCLYKLSPIIYFSFMELLGEQGFFNRLPVENFNEVSTKLILSIATKIPQVIACQQI
jgi:hypothetical protein